MEHNLYIEREVSCEQLPDEESIERALNFLLDSLGDAGVSSPAGIELTVIITDDEGIREINREHRRKDSATDVLSFPLQHYDELDEEDVFIEIPGAEYTGLGDIIISCETCIKQAEEIGHSISDEFYRLLVHGLLHLLGYDHERSTEDEMIMKEKEDLMLETLSRYGM